MPHNSCSYLLFIPAYLPWCLNEQLIPLIVQSPGVY